MAWFAKGKASLEGADKRTLGEGVFRKCADCGETLRSEDFEGKWEVCPACGYHDRISAESWIELLLDAGTWVEHDARLSAGDPLGFVDTKPYPARIAEAVEQSGVNDAFVAGTAELNSRTIQFGCFMFRFMGGSMGSVVGEKITLMFERALRLKQPVVLLSSSGGARMQEGALSLMQMAKTVTALNRFKEAGLPFISVLLNPTTGGVAASFAMLGDINIAEPRALIGFAGPRVIEDTIGQSLPEGFQRSEFLLEHGMIDVIAERHEMRATIARALDHLLG